MFPKRVGSSIAFLRAPNCAHRNSPVIPCDLCALSQHMSGVFSEDRAHIVHTTHTGTRRGTHPHTPHTNIPKHLSHRAHEATNCLHGYLFSNGPRFWDPSGTQVGPRLGEPDVQKHGHSHLPGTIGTKHHTNPHPLPLGSLGRALRGDLPGAIGTKNTTSTQVACGHLLIKSG